MTLADRTAGEVLHDGGEVDVQAGPDGGQMVVQLRAHPLHLGVGLGLDGGQLPGGLALQDHRVGETLAAEVGAAGVVGVVDPQAGGLVFAVEGDEFDVEQGIELAFGAFLLPFSITVKAIEVIDTYHLDTFFPGHVEGLLHVFERTEGIRGVQMGVDIKNLFHMNSFK